jgi:hypothetical protein
MDSTISLSVANLAPASQLGPGAPVEPPPPAKEAAAAADPVKPAGPGGHGRQIDLQA